MYWCLPACKSVHQVHAVSEIPEESIRAPGTEVTVASCLVGAKNQTQVHWKSSQCSVTTEPSLTQSQDINKGLGSACRNSEMIRSLFKGLLIYNDMANWKIKS